MSGRPSGASGGTSQVTASDTTSAAYRSIGRGNRTCRAVSTARYTATRTPADTSELTNHVAPNSSAN
jgi:hypothetical protein